MRAGVILLVLILAGCSGHRAPPVNGRLSDPIMVVAQLNEQLGQWRGTPDRKSVV